MSHREAANRYAERESASRRDIGFIPLVVNEERRERATNDLEYFCRQYQPAIFTRSFAPMHKEVIDKLTSAINYGDLFAYAMPRGTGKTSLAEAACIWAVLTGRRRYVVLISATEKDAQQSLDNIKKELSTNELILEDWPEAVFPFWALQGISHRAAGQTYMGKSTHIVWKGERIVFPVIPGSKCAGSLIEIRGLTGAMKGMKANLPEGKGSVRPEFVILDDPQTDESARSPAQSNYREEIILGTILGLSGHDKEISVVMPCTVIHKGDLADRFLSRDAHPEWHGTRTGLLTSLPTNTILWEEYAEKKREGDDAARQFYIENRQAMDKGASPLLPEWYGPRQISAIQYAMDLKLRVGELAFWSEYQNDPIDTASDGDIATADDICTKVTRFKRWEVPPNCYCLTAFIDVHRSLLYYIVVGWTERFDGYIIQYGTWPSVKRKYFLLSEIKDALQRKYQGRGVEGAIYAGLKDLTEELLFRKWGDSGLHIERCFIDANWKTSLVKTFCRDMKYTSRLLPTHGRYIGASRKPLNEYRKATGDRQGLGWRIPGALSREGTKHIIYDTNYWKSFINTALLTQPGDRGCLQLFSGRDHKLLAEHLTSEYYVEVSGRGRVVQEWQLYPGRKDNHWLDGLVGCAVSASLQGCRLIDTKMRRRGPRISYLNT